MKKLLVLLALLLALPALAADNYRIDATAGDVVTLRSTDNGTAQIPHYMVSVGNPAVTGSSGNVANASAAATLTSAVGKTAHINGFQCTGAGATAASVVTVTVAGVITGTMSYSVAVPAGVTTGINPLIVSFPRPVPASATNTNIVVTMPALGAGNTNAVCSAQGHLL